MLPVNVPIHITLAKAVELDFIFTIDIHPKTILSIEMERIIGAISVVPGVLEIDAQETLRKIDPNVAKVEDAPGPRRQG